MIDKILDTLRQVPLAIAATFMRKKPGEPGSVSSEVREKEELLLRIDKLKARLSSGDRMRFLPLNEGYTEETQEMRDAYRVMLREPMVKAAVYTKIFAVAALDIQVQPGEGKEIDKDAADFVKWALQKSKRGTRGIVTDILTGGLIEGFSISEKKFKIARGGGRWDGKLTLDCLKPKDPQYVELIGDEYRNIQSVRDRRTGQNYDPSLFVIFQHMPLYGNVTGMSDFRAAYRAYWLKNTAWQLRGVALERFTLPMLKGTYASSDDKPQLEDALKQARSQSWMALPETAQVEALELASRGTSDFQAAIKDLDEEVVIGITGAVLQMLQGQVSDGRGSSETHRGTAELLQWYLAAEIGDLITDQIATDLTSLNFTGAATPTVTFGGVNDGSMTGSLAIDSGLLQMGLTLSKSEMYTKYGRQEPTEDDDRLMSPSQQQGPDGGPGGFPPSGGFPGGPPSGGGGGPGGGMMFDDEESLRKEFGDDDDTPGPDAHGHVDMFAWSAFKTARGTVGARDGDKRLYGKAAARVLATSKPEAKSEPAKPAPGPKTSKEINDTIRERLGVANEFTPDLDEVPVKGYTAQRMVKQAIGAANPRMAAAAHMTGVLTDGRFLSKATPKETMLLQAQLAKSGIHESFGGGMAKVMKDYLQSKPGAPAKIVGVREGGTGPRYMIEAGGKSLIADANYVEAIEKRHPKAEMSVGKLPGTGNSAIYWHEGGKAVALLVPMAGEPKLAQSFKISDVVGGEPQPVETVSLRGGKEIRVYGGEVGDERRSVLNVTRAKNSDGWNVVNPMPGAKQIAQDLPKEKAIKLASDMVAHAYGHDPQGNDLIFKPKVEVPEKEIVRELDSIEAEKQAMRSRSMRYQADEKDRVGAAIGVSGDDLDLPYAEWAAIRDAHNSGDAGEARRLAAEYTRKPEPPKPDAPGGKPAKDKPALPPAEPGNDGEVEAPKWYKSFSSPEEAHRYGYEQYESWANTLSKDEYKAVGRYINDTYRPINNGLRASGGAPPPGYEEAVKNIDAALNRAVTPENLTVFRGLGAGVISKLKPGQTFTDQGYTSTSLARDAAENYGSDVTMEIRVPKGENGAYAQALFKNPNSPGREQEFLLPRGSTFKINSITENNGKTHVEAELVRREKIPQKDKPALPPAGPGKPLHAPGDSITFTPHDKSDSVVAGKVVGEVRDQAGNRGWNVNPGDPNDPGKVLRVWEGKGSVAKAETAKAKAGNETRETPMKIRSNVRQDSPHIGREWNTSRGKAAIDGQVIMGDGRTMLTVRDADTPAGSGIKRLIHPDELEAEIAREEHGYRSSIAPIATQEPPKPDFSGFTSSMSPMLRSRIEKSLMQSVRSGGEFYTMKSLVEKKVAEGYRVVDGPKGRRLTAPDGRHLDERQLSKSAFDYAIHLANKDAKQVESFDEAPTPIPDVRQDLPYDCGAAATKAVADHFGLPDLPLEWYRNYLGTNEQDGTSPDKIADFFRGHNLHVVAGPMSLDSLRSYTALGYPVICPYQKSVDSTTLQHGHYVAVGGVDDKSVYFHDPVHGPSQLTLNAFDGRWKDVGADGKLYLRHGIAVGKGTEDFDDEQLTTPQDAPQGHDEGKDVAGSIRDTYAVQGLLNASEREGTAVLADVTRSAIIRHAMTGDLATAVNLFSPEEMERLSAAMSKVLASSNLLGRARVVKAAEKISALGEDGLRQFADDPDEPLLHTFADEPIAPIVPELAVDYFRSLVPTIGVDPVRFGQSMRRDAFTLAKETGVSLLERIKGLIGDTLETGVGAGGGTTAKINAILDAAGVSPRNPQYGEMVFRTNMMDAYNTGADEARQDPEIADMFPVWQYMGIRDGRQRPEHEVHFGKFFPNAVAFASVRDSVKISPWNCRCGTRPISKWTWAKMQVAGSTVESFPGGMPSVSTFAERAQFPTDPTCLCCCFSENETRKVVSWKGLRINIEYPKGSTRSGIGKDGKLWSRVMNADYGHMPRYEGADGDHVDVYLGPDLRADTVYVIPQTKEDGSFDEHKIMIGYRSWLEAERSYLSHLPPDWTRYDSGITLDSSRLASWLASGSSQKS